VQSVLAPNINASAARVLARLGIALESAPGEGCCGALSYHLAAVEEAREFARRNIDAWWPYVESGGIEAIVMTASGCGVHVREYDRLLRDDPVYAEKAARVVALVRDIGEVLAREDLSALKGRVRTAKVAFHAPCTLQHGLRQAGEVERLLRESGLRLTPVPQPHLCCGSAGSYSILQPGIAKALRAQKLAALESGGPDLIATANIGCLLHLAAAARVPVVHWVELLAPPVA
jgi:glycolate oxidase iron-sulfur subunit